MNIMIIETEEALRNSDGEIIGPSTKLYFIYDGSIVSSDYVRNYISNEYPDYDSNVLVLKEQDYMKLKNIFSPALNGITNIVNGINNIEVNDDTAYADICDNMLDVINNEITKIGFDEIKLY